MNRFIVYGIASLLFLMGLVAFFDPAQINTVRRLAGLDALYRSETDLSASEREAALAALARTPVPGFVPGDAPLIGDVAAAAAACTEEVAGRSLSAVSKKGLARYFAMLAATGLSPDHPLVEPSLRPLWRLTGLGPMAVFELAGKGLLEDRDRDALAAFHEVYGDPGHPLYAGLGLYDGTFDGLDFQKGVAVAAAEWEAVGTCAIADAVPPLAEWEPVAVE